MRLTAAGIKDMRQRRQSNAESATDVKNLIPECDYVTPITANDKCELKPCLWARRQTTCEKLDCLKITPEHIVKTVMS